MSSGPTYLGRYFDPELDLAGISRKEIERQQVDRLLRALSVTIVAGSIPRRLGSDASPDELATDKRHARRVGHALAQAIVSWSGKKVKLIVTEEIKREGAQLNWKSWQEVFLAENSAMLRLAATYAVLRNEEKWGKSALVKLENERSWISYALRG